MPAEKARVLYVDDNQDSRTMVSVMLSIKGYDVMTVATIEEAEEVAKKTHFDLYLVDLILSNGTGVDLCQTLRRIQPHAPVLYFSAAAYEADKKKALSVCGDGYLTKPATADDLAEAIENLLSSSTRPPRAESSVQANHS